MSKENMELPLELKGKQKKYLRGLAHHLEPVVYVGREGLSTSVVRSIKDCFKTRELIKIKLGQNCEVPKKEAADQLPGLTGATLVQLIGKTVVLFRPNKDLKGEQRIVLPKK
jgi:RNA-binding protein